jgi:hypothetical protein
VTVMEIPDNGVTTQPSRTLDPSRGGRVRLVDIIHNRHLMAWPGRIKFLVETGHGHAFWTLVLRSAGDGLSGYFIFVCCIRPPCGYERELDVYEGEPGGAALLYYYYWRLEVA